MNLEALFAIQHDAVRRLAKPTYQRVKLSHQQRESGAVGIVGAPGSGKTTILLQCARQSPNRKKTCLYINSDHLTLYNWPIEDVASTFYNHGGRTLLIDDLHKYPDAKRSLARIVRQCPELQVFFSTPTELKLNAVAQNTRKMPCMSFREYIAMTCKQELPIIPLEHILRFHRRLVEDINSRLTVLPLFKNYLKSGCSPATALCPRSHLRETTLDIINRMIEQDLCTMHGYTSVHAQQLKQVTGFIARHAPGKINVSQLARDMSLGRDTIKRYLHDLAEICLITMIYKRGNTPTIYSKPDKVYLHNTNLCLALQYRPDPKAIAETFLVNQLRNAGHSVHVPGDGKHILINHTYTLEAVRRGEKKNERLPRNHYLAVDGSTSGSLTRIPLWLFGLMY